MEIDTDNTNACFLEIFIACFAKFGYDLEESMENNGINKWSRTLI